MSDETEKNIKAPQNPKSIRVMLVDDSAVVRGFIARILDKEDTVEIVATASNGQIALSAMKRHLPDVILLDVEMPVMDGLSTIPEILAIKPDAKIIMCSTLTLDNADTTLKAMELGAVDCIAKPSSSSEINSSGFFKDKLLDLIKNIGRQERDKRLASTEPAGPLSRDSRATPRRKEDQTKAAFPLKRDTSYTVRDASTVYQDRPAIIAIGSSTGGPQALFTLLKHFGDLPVPVVITQHMPATFTALLAKHISEHTPLPCTEAEDGLPLENGKAYLARGGKHMIIRQKDARNIIQLDDSDPVNFCKPSVDPMLYSAIDIFGRKVMGIILTGMGHDGLESGRALAQKGGRLIAQDEKSSVVWGMPGAVATAGLCSEVMALDAMGPKIRDIIFGKTKPS